MLVQEQVIKQLQNTLTGLFSQRASGAGGNSSDSVAGELNNLFTIASQLLQVPRSSATVMHKGTR